MSKKDAITYLEGMRDFYKHLSDDLADGTDANAYPSAIYGLVAGDMTIALSFLRREDS